MCVFKGGCGTFAVGGMALAALMASTAFYLQVSPALAQAVLQQARFDIPSGPLSSALAAFGRQAGFQVTYVPDIAVGKISSGVSGTLSPRDAIARVLQGSNLHHSFNGGTVAVFAVNVGDGGGTTGDTVQLETINVSGAATTGWQGNPDAVYETPAGVSVLTAEDIQQKFNGNVDNALRSTPGTFTRMSESGAGVSVNIRGFEGFNRVNMTIDGVRQNFRFFNHGSTGGNVYVDSSLLAGVDVARGSVVDASGIGALAGTANFRTLDVDDILLSGNDWGGMVTAKMGTNGYNASVMTAGAARADLASVAAAFSYHESDDYEDGNGKVATGTWQDLKSGLAKLHLGGDSDHSLSLGGVWYDNDTQFSSTAMPITNQTYTAKYAYDPDSELINLRINGAYNITEGDYQAASGSAVVRDDGYGIDITNTSLFSLGEADVSFSYGGAYFRDDVDNGDNVLLSVSSGTQEVSGAFATAQLNWGIFEVIGGIRYDSYAISGMTQPFTFPAGPAQPVDNTGDAWSPKVTLAVSPLSWLQLYGTYEHSFRPPTVSETLFPGVHGVSNGVHANPNLQGERSKGWEAGFNIAKDNLFLEGDALRFKANYFANKVEDYIALDLELPAFRVYFVNLPGATDISGIELQGGYDAGFAFINLAYTNSEVVLPLGVYTGNGADSLGQLPEDYFTLDIGARFLDRKLTVGGQVRWVGESLRTGLLNIPIPPPIPVEDYTLYDLYASYEMSENAKIFINAENITDEFYLPALKYHNGDPGRGRQIVGGMTLRF